MHRKCLNMWLVVLLCQMVEGIKDPMSMSCSSSKTLRLSLGDEPSTQAKRAN